MSELLDFPSIEESLTDATGRLTLAGLAFLQGIHRLLGLYDKEPRRRAVAQVGRELAIDEAGATRGSGDLPELDGAQDGQALAYVVVPPEHVAGSAIEPFLDWGPETPGSSGNVRLTLQVLRLPVGASSSSLLSEPSTVAMASSRSILRGSEITGVKAGDLLAVVWTRAGGDALDTSADAITVYRAGFTCRVHAVGAEVAL